MKKVQIAILVGTLVVANPAVAEHPWHTDIPYASRGACESATADLMNGDIFWLPEVYPEVFDTGLAASFLARAFPCELNASDDQWYIADHRIEVLESDWFLRRQ